MNEGSNTNTRLEQQVSFLMEIDRLKTVLRQTPITDSSRPENTAEHSWHLALFALVFAEYATEPVDIARVVMMLLVHDLVEIDAGDVFVYAMNDSAVAAQQDADEQRAADRIFAMLPLDQGAELRALWDEFESKATPESRFAKTIVRLQPLLLNRASGGGSWSLHSVTADMTANLIRRTMQKDSVLTDYALALVDQAVVDGLLLPPNPNAASS